MSKQFEEEAEKKYPLHERDSEIPCISVNDLVREYRQVFVEGCEYAAPKWISVDERTPANNEWVWVCHPHGYGIKAMFVGQNKFGQMWRYDNDPMATFNKPSHWQPLPELPSPHSIEKH
jgi:hypothetical protein